MAEEIQSCGVILLAAGASTRMGQPKQLLAIDGVPLVRRSALAALASSARPVLVVLGANADRIRPCLADLNVIIAENADWAKGMGNSLGCGIRALTAAVAKIDATVIALADQPQLSGELIARLRQRQLDSGRSIVLSRKGTNLGPPALFLRKHFAKLGALRGDVGARSVAQANAAEVTTLEINDDTDLDTPDDYAAYLARR